jgi:histidine phosphotransferase ChpT
MTQTALASLVAARISHDLASPIGAIGNGLELLALTIPPSPELSLMEDSVADALARLQMLRLAFGAGTAPVPAADLLGALQTAGAGRLKVAAELAPETPRPLARRLILGTMCLSSALPRGGTVSLRPASDAPGRWVLHGQGKSLRIDPDLWTPLLAAQPPQVAPAQAHFALLAHLDGLAPQMHATDEEVWLTL